MIESSKKQKINRIVTPIEKKEDNSQNFTNILRPLSLSDYVWQDLIKKHLSVSIWACKIRKCPLDHMLFYGPPWLWKTTISNIIANEMNSNLKSTSWPAIEKQADLVSILSNLEEGDILFIDEIHRLRPQVEEILYTAMEDFVIDIMVGSWTWAQSVKMPLKKFTLIWATTKLSSLSSPLRDRFWNILKLDFYTEDDLALIIKNNAKKLDLNLKEDILLTIARKSRWTPRIANRLLKILRDYAIIWKNINDENIVNEIFKDIWIDELWLDYLDRKYLETLYYKFSWKAVWLNTLSSAIGEEESTLEDVVEPYLLQIGFIERTPRWRIITMSWINHLLWK